LTRNSVTTVVAAVTFNLVDELEAYVLIKKGIIKTVDGSMPELPRQYLLSMLCEERKMPLSCEAREQL